MDSCWSRWRSCHLYYHGDTHLLLSRLVAPLVADLLADGAIDRFFFVHYELGGPHVRLRLRATGRTETLDHAVEQRAEEHFSRHPSPVPRPVEQIARRTQDILRADPTESDATLYPDNSFRMLPFLPEVDRYGGPERIEATLTFFALSSARALRFSGQHGLEPRSRQLPAILRTLASQALGFAREPGELLQLLGYASEVAAAPGHPLAPFVARGDRAFEQQEDALRGRLVAVATETHDDLQAEARGLRRALGDAPPPVRLRILKSHMHMTANRQGLNNPEEAYLGRMLWRAAQEGGGLAPALAEAWRSASESPLDEDERLEDLLPTAFAAVVELGDFLRR